MLDVSLTIKPTSREAKLEKLLNEALDRIEQVGGKGWDKEMDEFVASARATANKGKTND